MNLIETIKKAIELAMPDFRHYYRIVKKARVVSVYPSEGKYYCDVQPLKNDETADQSEPIVPKVHIPILWGGNNRGVICSPTIGVLCDLAYYDGDPNYPFISNIRWDNTHQAPQADLNEFLIQLEPGVELRIDKAKNLISLTPKSWKVDVGENAQITASGKVQITAQADITLDAPSILQKGNVTSTGQSGGKGQVNETADRQQNGNLTINGTLTVNGNVNVSGNNSVAGNSHAGSRSGGII